MKFQGVFTAIVTPFANAELDLARLAEQIEFQIAGGVDGLVPCGTTGESPTLSHDEHQRVVAVTCERVAGRLPVVAGAGSNNTREAIALTRHAKAAGAAATLQVVPYYNKPTQEGLYQHFRAIAEAVELPVMLYNIPGRSGTGLTPETIARLRNDCPTIAAIKEATGSLDQASEIAALCDIAILSGDDSLTLPLAAVGGQGVVSVLSNVLPARVKALTTAFLSGEWTLARQIHHELFALGKAMFVETNPIPVKTAMALLGRDSGELRLPMCPMRPDTRQRLRQALTKHGLIRE